MIAKAIINLVKLVSNEIMFNKLTGNKAVNAFSWLIMALVNTSVIKLAKILPHKLTAIESINEMREIIKPNLKCFHKDFTKRLIVPFLGLVCSLKRGPGIINYLLSVFEKHRLLYKSHCF